MAINRLVATFILLVGTTQPSFANTCLPYEPALVNIAGKLSLGHGYGPPNFGEDPAHDQIEVFGLITLDQPICVSHGESTDVDIVRITELQLIPSKSQKLDRRLVGHRIVAAGKLFHRVSGGHTDVMILYDEIHKAL